MAKQDLEDSSSIITSLKKSHLGRLQEAIHAVPVDKYLKITKFLTLSLFVMCIALLVNYMSHIDDNFQSAFNKSNLMISGAKSMGEVMTEFTLTKRVEIYSDAVWLNETTKNLINQFYISYLVERLP